MPTIYIDGTAYEVEEGKNLLEACLAPAANVPWCNIKMKKIPVVVSLWVV